MTKQRRVFEVEVELEVESEKGVGHNVTEAGELGILFVSWQWCCRAARTAAQNRIMQPSHRINHRPPSSSPVGYTYEARETTTTTSLFWPTLTLTLPICNLLRHRRPSKSVVARLVANSG